MEAPVRFPSYADLRACQLRSRRIRGLGALAILAAFLAFAVAGPVRAQFGQNKVQYRDSTWSVLKTTHFEIYFRDGLREAAVDAGRMAERAWSRLSVILDHEPTKPIPIVLYGSQAEFQQTNLTPEFIGEGTGGFTEFTRRRVAVPLTGSYGDFDHVLTHELVHAFQIDILTGGGERSLLGPTQYVPPLWFMEGMAEYLSIGRVDHLTEMWLRDGALRGYLTSVNMLEQVGDIRIYRYGQALMAYLGATYGDETIGKILKRLPHLRSLDRAMQEVVGLTMEKFSEDWTEAVRKEYLPQIRDHRKPEDFAFRLTNAEKDLSNLNCTPAVSPDGDLVAYFSDRSLSNDLYCASALTGEVQRRLVKSERRADFESLRFFRSAMDWSPDGENVVFVALENGRDAIYIQRASDGKVLRRLSPDLDGILSPSFSPDGTWIVFCGQQGGQSDLWRVRADGSGLERLTNDRYLAQEPRYSPDGKKIVFVTDQGVEADFQNLIFSQARLAIFDLATREVSLLPAQAGTNISPFYFPDGRHLLFLSDRSGIANVWIRDLETNEDRRITDVLAGISGVTETSPAASLSRDGRRVVFTAFTEGTTDLFAIKDPLDRWKDGVRWNGPYPVAAGDGAGPDYRTSAGGPEEWAGAARNGAGAAADSAGTGRGGAANSAGAGTAPDSARIRLRVPVVRSAPSSALPDTSGVSALTTTYPTARTPSTARLDSLMTVTVPVSTTGRERRRFSNASRPFGVAPDSSDDRTVEVQSVIQRRRTLPDSIGFRIDPYRTRFAADYVAANGFFAGNVGVAAQSMLQFSDVLGDQVIVVGANIYGNISDSDLLFQYVNLRRRLNWAVAAFQYRNDYYIFAAQQNDQFISQVYRGASLALQRPFSRFRRVEWSLDALAVSNDVVQQSNFSGDIQRLQPQNTRVYLVPGMALVSDNTVFGPTGPIAGGRSRLSAEVAIGDLSYQTYIADARRYLNMRHQYAFATRVIGAVSTGSEPQFFRIGGPYTLRGWPYGDFQGTKVALGSVELRVPLIDYLRVGFPLPMALGGVRGAFFFDAGAAWDDNRAFQAVRVRNGVLKLEDIRASYGVTASLNVGFTVLKWDVAWRTDLARNLGPARGYFSFGLDY
jgi:Tol biopolymer transport system component